MLKQLPYVYQGAVDQFYWLSANQMMDGLALGKTTPGPLIMVVAFVGYLAGHIQHLIGYSNPFWYGVLGTVIATWFTFLSSFFFILVGGPLVDHAWKNELHWAINGYHCSGGWRHSKPGLFFAYHVFLPHGLGGSISWISIAICGLAGLALFKYQKRCHSSAGWLGIGRTSTPLCRRFDRLSFSSRLA